MLYYNSGVLEKQTNFGVVIALMSIMPSSGPLLYLTVRYWGIHLFLSLSPAIAVYFLLYFVFYSHALSRHIPNYVKVL